MTDHTKDSDKKNVIDTAAKSWDSLVAHAAGLVVLPESGEGMNFGPEEETPFLCGRRAKPVLALATVHGQRVGELASPEHSVQGEHGDIAATFTQQMPKDLADDELAEGWRTLPAYVQSTTALETAILGLIECNSANGAVLRNEWPALAAEIATLLIVEKDSL